MWRRWLLLVAICAACALARSARGLRSLEAFAINDYYDRYLNDISVPAAFYGQTKYASGFKKVEMNDRFFIDVLSKASDPSAGEGLVRSPGKHPVNLLEKASVLIASILNGALPSEDNRLFAVAHSHMANAAGHEGNRWLVDSEHIVHRDGKVYGAVIAARTLQSPQKTVLVGASLKGFVLEDRINALQPHNLAASEGDSQPFMQDRTFLRDPKYEHEYICRYLSDLEKFRGIKTPGAPDCSDVDIT